MLKKTILIIIFSFVIYSPLLAQEFEDFENGNETYDIQELEDYGFKLYESDKIDIEKLKKLYKKPPKEEYLEDYEKERYYPKKEKPSKEKAIKAKKKEKREHLIKDYNDEIDIEKLKKLYKKPPEEEYLEDYEEERYHPKKEKPSKEKAIKAKRKEKREYLIKDYKVDEDYPFEEDYKRDFIKDYGEEEARFDHMPMDDIFSSEYSESEKDEDSYREYYEPEKDKASYREYYEPKKDKTPYRKYYEPEKDEAYHQKYSEPEEDEVFSQKYYQPEKTLKTCPAKMPPLKKRLPPKNYEKLKKKEKISASQKELLAITTKPSWLFTIPTAFSLNENAYRIGFLHADMGMGNNMEIGIKGFKWRFSKYGLGGFTPAIGAGLISNYALIPFKPSTPGVYGVATLDIDTFNLHVGVKTLPYWGFMGADFNLSDKLKITAEANDGILFGLRYNLSEHWNFGLALGYVNIGKLWKFSLDDKESEEFKFCVQLDIFYFNKFEE